MITKENYEAYLLDKAEGNLSEQLLKELEDFLKANPQLQPEEDAYDEAFVMKYDSYGTLPYEDELLKKPVIIPSVWKAVSIAASIALLIGVFFFLQQNEEFSSPVAVIKTQNGISQNQNGISQNQNGISQNQNGTSVKRNDTLFQRNAALISSDATVTKSNIKKSATNKETDIAEKENISSESEKEITNEEITGVNLIAYEPNLIEYGTNQENTSEIQVEKGLIEYEKQPIFNTPKPIRINIPSRFENINIASNK